MVEAAVLDFFVSLYATGDVLQHGICSMQRASVRATQQTITLRAFRWLLQRSIHAPCIIIMRSLQTQRMMRTGSIVTCHQASLCDCV